MKRRKVIEDGPDPIDKYVGSRVRARRMGLRLSQTKLGEAIGVTFQQVQKYENGANRIGASNLYKIGRTLGVEVGFFFEGMPDYDAQERGGAFGLAEEAAVFDHDPMSSREAIELMHNYFRIKDPLVRNRLFQFVRSLSKSDDGDDGDE